jgi:hypothetical protein
MQYRTRKNYTTGAFLGPRVGDKLIFSLLIFTCAPPLSFSAARLALTTLCTHSLQCNAACARAVLKHGMLC